jgi:hypothetical protein
MEEGECKHVVGHDILNNLKIGFQLTEFIDILNHSNEGLKLKIA